ncbi:hypothetical protein ACH4YO_20790 [Streptomyces noursei]|uniref:hypothetical protein n=1 Tax=Streptomyces noursei TaxID=1971 RepID=UPI0033C933A2
MRKAVRRLVAATGVLVTAAALPVVATAPAQANTIQCTTYLDGLGYKVGPNVRQACQLVGNDTDWTTRHASRIYCVAILTESGVRQNHADKACDIGLLD